MWRGGPAPFTPTRSGRKAEPGVASVTAFQASPVGAIQSRDDDRVIVHAALVDHADGFARAGGVERGDSPVALLALFVDVHVDILHLREDGHLDAAAPGAAQHAVGVRLDAVVVGVIGYPVFDGGVRYLDVGVLHDVAADVTPQRRGGGAVAEAVAQRVEEAGAVGRLRHDLRVPHGGRALAGSARAGLDLPVRRPCVGVVVPNFLEVRTLVRLVRAVALVAAFLPRGRRLRGRLPAGGRPR
mmetsp:Transcript_5682/g.16156  ORF Transcript_5682/g.16156 Transcript_5682/m.16156 type:complete len:242 (-) Transcript_5682:9-734(-)